MTKKVVTPNNESAGLIVKLQKEVARLEKKVLSLENEVLKSQNKSLKLEQKYLMLEAESKKSKSVLDFMPVDLSKYKKRTPAQEQAAAVIEAGKQWNPPATVIVKTNSEELKKLIEES